MMDPIPKLFSQNVLMLNSQSKKSRFQNVTELEAKEMIGEVFSRRQLLIKKQVVSNWKVCAGESESYRVVVVVQVLSAWTPGSVPGPLNHMFSKPVGTDNKNIEWQYLNKFKVYMLLGREQSESRLVGTPGRILVKITPSMTITPRRTDLH